MSDHLTESELAGFLDQDLSAAELARVREHLDACDECRGELVEVGRLLDAAPAREAAPPVAAPAPEDGPAAPPAGQEGTPTPPAAGPPAARRPRWRAPLGAAGFLAAAAVAVLVFSRPDGEPAGTPAGQQRVGEPAVAELRVHGPRDGSSVARQQLRFAWAPHGAASYRISITREDGGLLWSRVVEDTVAVPPAAAPLPAGEPLYWYVDAVTGGAAARTRVHTVRVLP